MKKRITLRTKTNVSVKTALRRRLITGAAGVLVLVAGGSLFYFNFFQSHDSLAGDVLQQPEDLLQEESGQPEDYSACYASEIISYMPTKRNDGTPVAEEHRVAAKALGAPEGDDTPNYVSLGFGGEIVLKFPQPIANGNGHDIKITETTYGNNPCNRYPEKIQAFASQDGCHYIYLGEGCQDAYFDLGPMSWAQYIKIKDISPVTHPYANQVADGYDLDGIECLNGAATETPDDGLVFGSPQDIVQYVQGVRKNGTAIHPSRTNPEMALGVPQDDDLGVNFVAMGFSGVLVLKFDYVIFNQEGEDLQVIETSFGIPHCDDYPEEAFFEGSLDGQHWTPMGEVCLDGKLDLGPGVYAIQYIRITDRSRASQFPNSADGYDLDGISVLSGCPGEKRIVPYDNNTVPDEIAEIKVLPNPFKDNFSLQYETGSLDEDVQIRVFNYVGQQVIAEQVSIPRNTNYTHQINGSGLPKGVYIVSIESGGLKQSMKMIKN